MKKYEQIISAQQKSSNWRD